MLGLSKNCSNFLHCRLRIVPICACVVLVIFAAQSSFVFELVARTSLLFRSDSLLTLARSEGTKHDHGADDEDVDDGDLTAFSFGTSNFKEFQRLHREHLVKSSNPSGYPQDHGSCQLLIHMYI
eukprot:TRINITY_DN43030_c0_g1_i1.p1 TRINITY_DN43030_c0_g1~~TRINITY_DN43030_c0_g1_i1.p1  ORF type:complete len:124 (+),score=7.89 TRINITY_DN43030_c0_g1_i1:87-458(+)